MTIYRKGSTVSVQGVFKLAGAGYNPAAVECVIHKPRSPDETKVKADMLNDSTGTFVLDLPLVERGTWRLRWKGTGTYTDSQGRTRPYAEEFTQVLRVYA